MKGIKEGRKEGKQALSLKWRKASKVKQEKEKGKKNKVKKFKSI